MKKRTPGFGLLGFYFLISVSLTAQNAPEFLEWIDEAHYLLQSNEDDGAKWFQVNAATGETTDYTPPEDLTDQLPDGVRLRRGNFAFSDDQNALVLIQDSDLFFFNKGMTALRQLTANPSEEKNPVFSPDGTKIAYTRDHNLFVLDLQTGLERQLTTDGSDLVYNAWASWVYYEEILGRGSRYRAFYWSPDSKRIAFLRFDDSPVPLFPIYHHIGGDGVHGELENTRYPKAGDPNPLVRLGIAEVENGAIQWVQTDDELEYTAWVFWTPDASELFFQQLNRDQNLLKIYAANPETGARREVCSESRDTWVEFFEAIYFLKDKKGFLLRSNRDDWYNLYHYDLDGHLVKKITDFDWRVTEVVRVDEENGRVFFSGTGPDDPTESHFFVIGLDGKNFRQLTRQRGTHSPILSPGGDYFVDLFSAYNNPGQTDLFDTSGKHIRSIAQKTNDPNKSAGLTVEPLTIPTSDGFQLPAYWVLPPDFDKSKKYPVIFSIYGGPDAGTVFNRYRNFSWNPLYAKGVIRFTVDHRASGKFGKKGLDFMHRNLGKWEMHDYIEAVKWLRQQPFIDPDRIGIEGSSYGGYMTVMALTYGADYFTHGVAGSSVTDWRLYDNIYTERYMDTPEDNPDGYRFGAAMTHADQLKGHLLIIHGTIDDNVHLQNSIQLISALQDKGKDFELMLYPGGRHGWGGPKRRHSFNLGLKFWEKYFFGEE